MPAINRNILGTLEDMALDIMTSKVDDEIEFKFKDGTMVFKRLR
jgi:hypothetical protein